MKKQVKHKPAEFKSFVNETLRKYTGLTSLKIWQEKVIQSILSQKDNLIVMPSSDRKYICFYLPIIILKGRCLVISQSEKFLNNQHKFLTQLGIPFALWDKNTNSNIELTNPSKVFLIKDIINLEKLKEFSALRKEYCLETARIEGH